MKSRDYSIERKHKTTGAVFYLKPNRQEWATPRDHQKYGTLYGHWFWDEAYENLAWWMRNNDPCTPSNFDYQLVPHHTIHKPWKKIK